MPELPEIRLYTKNLNKLISGKKVEDMRCFTDGDFSFAVGRIVERVVSYGKGIYFEIRGGGNIYVHLMLTGAFAFVDKNEYPSVKGKMLALKFDENYLIVKDENRYAKIEKNKDYPKVPEATGKGFTIGYFLSLMDGRGAVKNVLTNQQLIVGLGNAYADEILYRAKISPFSVACKIPLEESKKLYAAIFDVMEDAEKYLEKYRPNMISGEDRNFFKVHIRGADVTDDGEPISVKDLGGRKTYYTESQRVYK